MPKEILALVDDLFFSTKIGSTALSCGVPVHIFKDQQSLFERALKNLPGLIIVDLNSTATQPLEVIRVLKSDPHLCLVPLVGYFSHVDGELKERATSAGCDNVLPRSAFSRDLARILKEYAQ